MKLSVISIWLLTVLPFRLHTAEALETNLTKNKSLAHRVCKPGPHAEPELYDSSRKCLIIGDSVSIGYQVWVAKNLKGACDVIHSPWDYVDGGALDSKYGLQCLTFLISTFNLKKVHYDAIVFNFGLHDVDCFGNSPEEYTTAAEYHQNIQRLKTSLLKTGAKVGFVLTTPIPYNKSRNEMVVHYNNIAREIMAEKPSIQVANLYQWVVNVCGEPPYNSCKISDKQPSPHYTVDGYRYLATLVTKLFHHLLSEVEKQPKKIVLLKSVTSKISIKDSINIQCKGKSGKVVTACPSDTTCCTSKYSACGVGCCLLPDAVDCGDGKHCCPAGYSCDTQCNENECFCLAP